jgi:Domain of unknown function (DUF1990)
MWSVIRRTLHAVVDIDEVEDPPMQATRLDQDVEARLRAAELTDDHVGRASGVLPQEAFVVERADDDSVSLNITAFARPASSLARLAGPFGRLAQRMVTERYLLSLQR